MTELPPPPPSVHVVAPGRAPGASSALGNVIWCVVAGVWLAIAYVVAGVTQCLTIIGIPFGIQSFKLAGFALWPFGRVVVQLPNARGGISCIGNVLWFVLSGLWLAIAHVVVGSLLCLTIVGIPFGIQSFKLAGMALTPFGKTVVKKGSALPAGSSVVIAI
jgi:uncharacterized membrane protein YccF (DUF307 family)